MKNRLKKTKRKIKEYSTLKVKKMYAICVIKHNNTYLLLSLI